MFRGIHRLTDADIRNAKPDPEGRRKLVLPDGGNLRLLITPAGQKYWQMRIEFEGKETTLHLGHYPDMGLAEARERAAEMRAKKRKGIDVATERKLQVLNRKANQLQTFRAVAEDLIVLKRQNGVSDVYCKKIEKALTANIYPNLGSLHPAGERLPPSHQTRRPAAASAESAGTDHATQTHQSTASGAGAQHSNRNRLHPAASTETIGASIPAEIRIHDPG